jgi:hypothetical protein
MHGVWIAKHLPNEGLQDEASFAAWLLTAILAAWMLLAGIGWTKSLAAFLRRSLGPVGALKIDLLRTSQFLAVAVVSVIVASGLAAQVRIGHENLNPNSPANRLTPDAAAAEWIGSHTDAKAVIMARHVPTACHYSGREIVWFPPSSNPQLLMEGIEKHKIDYVVVVRRENSYYLPSDDDCFAPLLKAYPTAFRLVNQGAEFRIFEVTSSHAAEKTAIASATALRTGNL